MTASALQLCVEAVVDKVSVVPGIKQAPDYPPEKLVAYPFIAVFSWGGNWEWGAMGSLRRGLHNIAVEVHINRKILPLDVEKAMIYSDSIPNAIFSDPTLGGTCSTFEGITYEFGDMGWANVDTLGFRFIINNIKIESEIT